MSEKIKIGNSYDLSKNITGIEINPGFILGLENVIIRYITQIHEDPAALVSLFKKFTKVITGELSPEEANLNEIESEIYTLFAIQQVLKAYAHNQGLVKDSDVQIEKVVVEELLSEFSQGNMDKVKEITETISKIMDDLSQS